MSHKENIEKEIAESSERTKQHVKHFVQISFEQEAKKEVSLLKKRINETDSNNLCPPSSSSPSSPSSIYNQKENDGVYVASCDVSIGTVIKCEALLRREKYHSLDTNNKAIVSLGLNSIVDLSFDIAHAQSFFFTRQQWKQLRNSFPQKKYEVSSYSHLLEPLETINSIYNDKKSRDVNWLNIYKELKKLDGMYDKYIEPEHNDLSFCIFLLREVMLLLKNYPFLFSEDVDVSEWDYVVKFWGVVTERLFSGTGLRLKWGDTHLTVHDTMSNLLLKVDLRILHDKVKQRYNVESEVGVMEAAEEQPGTAKYVWDRCKVLLESKAVIDRFLLNGCMIENIDYLQVCGLEVHFGSITLPKPGLYVGSQFYSAAIDNSLSNINKYLDLAFHLLCFRDQCITISNQYENHLIKSRTNKVSTKRPADCLPHDDLITKQSYIRGSWNPPRTAKSSPPPQPKNLFGNL